MERPEPISSPQSANAPLISRPAGGSEHRALTKGVKGVVRLNISAGKSGTKTKRKKAKNNGKSKKANR